MYVTRSSTFIGEFPLKEVVVLDEGSGEQTCNCKHNQLALTLLTALPSEGASFPLDSSDWSSSPSAPETESQEDSQSQDDGQDYGYGDDYADDADPSTITSTSLSCGNR